MRRTSLILVGLLALSALALGAQAETAEVAPPLGLDQATGQTDRGTLFLEGGSASIVASTPQGSAEIWTKRVPCLDRSESACMYSSSSEELRSVDVDGGSITLAPRDGVPHRTVVSTDAGGNVTLEALQTVLVLNPEEETRELVEDDDPPDRFREATVPKGVVAAFEEQSTFNAQGTFNLISTGSRVTLQDGGNSTTTVETGWSWDQGEDVPWYRTLRLVHAEASGALLAPWDGSALFAPELPFAFTAEEANVTLVDGQLGNQTAPANGTTVEDLEASVVGLVWNQQEIESSYDDWDPEDQEEHEAHHTHDVGRMVVEQGPAATPPPSPPTEDVSTTTLAATGAAALAAIAAIGYYWPRISWGLSMLLLPLYSRIEKDELFENDVRENLYELIQDDPGVHAHALSEAADIGWGTTVYHLRRLERNGFVTSEKRGRYRRFFPASGFMARQREVLSVLQNDTTNDIARLVLREPGLNQKAICEELDISPSLANWHLNRLLDAELVERERRGRTVHYTPGPAWESIQDAVDVDIDAAVPA